MKEGISNEEKVIEVLQVGSECSWVVDRKTRKKEV